MYLPRLGAWRGWQIPHDEFAKCLLAASGFRAPWSNEKDKTQGLPARRAPASEVRGALVWPLTCKCCSQRLIPPPPSPSSPDPASIPLSTQSPGPGGLHNLPLRIPPLLATEVSLLYQLCCKTVLFWTLIVDWKILPVTCSGSGLFGVHSCFRCRHGPCKGFWNEKEY